MKAFRQTKTRTLRNKKVKDGVTYLRRSVRKALESKELAEAEKLVKETIRALDKAMQKGVMKKNTGSRLKSRLSKRLAAAKKPAKA